MNIPRPIARIFLAPSLLFFALLAACDSAPPELEQAADGWGSMAKGRNLRRSVFPVAYPDQKPSEFVKFAFSPMGTAEWPPGEGWVDPAEAEAIGETVLPGDVAFFPNKPDPKAGKQVVVTANDAERKIVLTGYLDPAEPPALVREIDFPKVTQSASEREFSEALLRNNAGLGMEY